jgi:predicted RND superfamily exporter protein/CRP-like cAMP-binding protein
MFEKIFSKEPFLSIRMLKWIVRNPFLVITIIASITLFFAFHIPKLSFKTSIYDLVIENIPETTQYEKFKKLFGSDEIIRIVIKGGNVFDPANFRQIERMAENAAGIAGVKKTISLPGIKKAVDRAGNWDLEKFGRMIAPIDLFRTNLISSDRSTTAITVVLEGNADRGAVIREINDKIINTSLNLSVYQIGMPIVSQALASYTQEDFSRLPPITFILIAIILLCLFRRLSCILLPLTCVSLALTWTFGLMAWTGIPLSMVTMIVPVFLLSVGTAYCLHINSEYLHNAGKAPTPARAAFLTFSKIALPTVLAALTTAIGLGSLLVSRITAITEFAIFACFGIFSIIFILFTFFPAALALIPLPRKETVGTWKISGFWGRFLEKIARINLEHQKTTLLIIGAIAVFCIIGIFRIRVETNPVGYFKANTPVNRNFHDIYRNLSGSFPINMVMASKNEGYFENPDHINDIFRLKQFLETLPGIDKTVSFADYIKLVNYAMNGFEPRYYAIPEEAFEIRMLINNYTTMLGEDMLKGFMSSDFSRANILLMTHISSSRDFLETRRKILSYVKNNFSRDLAWEVTGFGIVLSASSHHLTAGQIKSLSLTLIIVFGIMFILFLSLRGGLVAIVPNLFPIIINFGLMGWFGVELSVVTSLIASIAIGLAVDDTIHYLFRYNIEYKKNLDKKLALKETIRQVGRPIIFTTLTISVGLSILAFSSFKPTAMFGVMMVITMISALAADLILLPSLMLRVELVTLWDLIKLKLGKDPQKGLYLFNGLSRTQIHYILMAGAIKELGSREILFRKGESGDTMYTIISGTMDLIDPLAKVGSKKNKDLKKLVERLKPGDILGAPSFIRNARRAVTAIAAEPAELLQINRRMIKRLQWLYPPAAHKFLLNLTALLCNRLEGLSRRIHAFNHRDKLSGLLSIDEFLAGLEIEIEEARTYNKNLCLCLMEIDIEALDVIKSNEDKNSLFNSLTNLLSGQIRNNDVLSRIDMQTLALLMPDTSIHKARQFYDGMLASIVQEGSGAKGLPLKVTFGLAELEQDDESGWDLIARATQEVHGGRQSHKIYFFSKA